MAGEGSAFPWLQVGPNHPQLIYRAGLWALHGIDAVPVSHRGIRRQCFVEIPVPRTSEVPGSDKVLPQDFLTIGRSHDDLLLVYVE